MLWSIEMAESSDPGMLWSIEKEERSGSKMICLVDPETGTGAVSPSRTSWSMRRIDGWGAVVRDRRPVTGDRLRDRDRRPATGTRRPVTGSVTGSVTGTVTVTVSGSVTGTEKRNRKCLPQFAFLLLEHTFAEVPAPIHRAGFCNLHF
jgi:hypothetical protein